jgi:hypothetical protein
LRVATAAATRSSGRAATVTPLPVVVAQKLVGPGAIGAQDIANLKHVFGSIITFLSYNDL